MPIALYSLCTGNNSVLEGWEDASTQTAGTGALMGGRPKEQ